MRFVRFTLLPALAAIAACTTQPAPRPVAVLSPLPATTAPAAFAGYGNLAVPPRLADGSYVTPNTNLSAAATIWHLRAGLNVAALACRGTQETMLIAGYNALLQQHRAAFDRAYRALSGEYGSTAAFDQGMTALYNYYALPAAQPGLCTTAQQILADIALQPQSDLAAFAPLALASLELTYTTVFARQDAWLASLAPRPTAGPVMIAVASTAAPAMTEPAVLRR